MKKKRELSKTTSSDWHTHKDFIESILDSSFNVFLDYSGIITTKSLNQELLEIPEGDPFDISPGTYVTHCQWCIAREINPPCDYPSDAWLKGYALLISYQRSPDIVFESYYALIYDKKYSKLHYHRRFVRVVEKIKDDFVPHLISDADKEIKSCDIVELNF